jgi:hypothetical protein
MCVQKNIYIFFYNLQLEQIIEKLVNFKFAKFSNPFEEISLTNTKKDKDNTSSEIDFSNIFPNVWLFIKTMHNVLSLCKK